MRRTCEMKADIKSGLYDDRLSELYLDEGQLDYQRKRYMKAVERFETLFGEGEAAVFSAPGRSEICGNHTDHQRGEVLAAALNIDAIAIAGKTDEKLIKVVSGDASEIVINLAELSVDEAEKGTTRALIKGVLANIAGREYKIGGFYAYITSDVLIGAGLSSSASFETLIGTVVSGLYNEGKISAEEIAMAGQYAERVYFGKPCGLMDQMASAVGNLVYIDFADEENPCMEQLECDFKQFGYSLCITDTKSSHADCTPEYAAVPAEMKAVAAVFDKEVLREVSQEQLFERIFEVREKAGDRAVLRALHFLQENKRVRAEVEALRSGDFERFLKLIKKSGDSSYKYLQNVYMNSDVEHQNVSLALAVSDVVLGDEGAARVHGGGFAGTIQAFVKNDAVERYRKEMNRIFGEGACCVYHIRKCGGIKVF